jgi:hypothetical protein
VNKDGKVYDWLDPNKNAREEVARRTSTGRHLEYTGKPDKGVRSNIHLSDSSTYAICSFTIAELTLSPWKKVQNCTFAGVSKP